MFGYGRQAREHLPAPVYDLSMRIGVRPGTGCSAVTLTQAGRMKRKLGA